MTETTQVTPNRCQIKVEGDYTGSNDMEGTPIRIGDKVICYPADEVREIVWNEYHSTAMINNRVMRWILKGRELSLRVTQSGEAFEEEK